MKQTPTFRRFAETSVPAAPAHSTATTAVFTVHATGTQPTPSTAVLSVQKAHIYSGVARGTVEKTACAARTGSTRIRPFARARRWTKKGTIRTCGGCLSKKGRESNPAWNWNTRREIDVSGPFTYDELAFLTTARGKPRRHHPVVSGIKRHQRTAYTAKNIATQYRFAHTFRQKTL